MRRFWSHAKAARDGEDFHILLDGKPMRLPGGAVLRIGKAALADAIAAEWQAAAEDVEAAALPLTQLAATAQSRVAADPAASVAALLRYGETDLLCYRATHPPALVARQAAAWQPWLDWAARALDAPLRATAGVMPIAQPPAALRALERALAAQTIAGLTGLGVAVPALGSLVLGLALASGALDATTAGDLAALEEIVQAQLWGEDGEAAQRRAAIAGEIAQAARFMELSG
jgi:chaperone required for assembly of F1-ATPase